MAHPSNKGPRFDHLREHQPDTARAVFGWLRQVRQMAHDRIFGPAAQAWCDSFEAQAYVQRNIGPRLRLIEGDGHTRDAELHWLRRETDVLERFPTHVGSDGREEVRLPDTLDDHLLEERNRVRRMATVRFPHTPQTAELPDDEQLVDRWCRNLKGGNGPEGLAWEDYPEAMAAAEKLVRTTGLVPRDDEELSMAASSGVL